MLVPWSSGQCYATLGSQLTVLGAFKKCGRAEVPEVFAKCFTQAEIRTRGHKLSGRV